MDYLKRFPTQFESTFVYTDNKINVEDVLNILHMEKNEDKNVPSLWDGLIEYIRECEDQGMYMSESNIAVMIFLNKFDTEEFIELAFTK